MNHDRSIVDYIERAIDARPWCPCGWHTTLVWRDGAIWLECASVTEAAGALARLVAWVSAPTHVHTRLIDVPGPDAESGTASLPSPA